MDSLIALAPLRPRVPELLHYPSSDSFKWVQIWRAGRPIDTVDVIDATGRSILSPPIVVPG